MSETHTKLPWAANIGQQDDSFKFTVGPRHGDFFIDPVAVVNKQSDAEFIVRACNSHADLVEAITLLFEHCAMIHKYGGEISNQREADEAIAKARAAIAKASRP